MDKKKMILAASVAGLMAVSSFGLANVAFAGDAAGGAKCAGKAGCKGKKHAKKAKAVVAAAAAEAKKS